MNEASPQNVQDLEKLQREWSKAEETLKLVEVITAQASIPSINELRFAGRTLLDAILLKDDLLRSTRIHDAIAYCQRAQRDAYDAALLSVLTEAKSMQDRGSALDGNVLAQLEAAKSLISESRSGERQKTDYQIDAAQLAKLHEALSAARSRRETVSSFARVVTGAATAGAFVSLMSVAALAEVPDKVSQALNGISLETLSVALSAVVAVIAGFYFLKTLGFVIVLDAPTNASEIAQWLVAFALFFMIAKFSFCKSPKWKTTFSQSSISDSVLFSTSAMLLVGVWSHETLEALGDLTPFLIFAGLAGIAASVRNISDGESMIDERELEARLRKLLHKPPEN